ncbi:MAG: 4-hydroxybutyrate coenzyme transferase [Cyanobacteria bacterium RYN_339]|nr:4-hydroxybutyrate coenzyme transferase [Cyanobacteria bacterium RYN_339]
MNRAVTPAEAVSQIHDHARIYVHGDCAACLPLEAALAERARGLEGLRVYQVHKDGPEVLADPALAGRLRIQSLFCGAGVRQAVAEGRADYIPINLSDIPAAIRAGLIPLDVAIVQLSWPDAAGYCSLGISVDSAWQAVQSAPVVIAELNRQMPRVNGPARVHLDDLAAFTVTDRPLIERHSRAATPEIQALGRHVAALVPDGATLQLGIGAIPDAILAALHGKQDLGLHTEMFSDRVVDLVEAGVITNRRKSVDVGKTVVAFVAGTRRTYDFVADNPAVEFRPTDYTNDLAVIRAQHLMTSINAALQVDLTGQVCSDSLGERIYSGVGGQLDFVRGAALAQGGKSILALTSRAREVGRIVPILSPGAGVVTPRSHVQYVVTEHGVADLRAQPLAARAERLIAIAHPDDRAALRAAAAGRRLFGF